MADEATSVEMNVPAGEVETTIQRLCAEWGVDRSAILVDVRPEPAGATAPGVVHLRVTRPPEPESAPVDAESQALLERAQQTLAELLDKMGIRAEVHASWGSPDEFERPVVLDVRGDDLGLLIGRKGETLAALQYITRLILSKEMGQGVDVIVDVQGHKKRREEQLRRMARRMAEQAVQRNKTMALEPMSAYERRIVHLELRDHPDVFTESVGEGEHRKVTIIPKQR